MWDAHKEVGFCSERVETLFRAVYNTSNEIAAKAVAVQKRNVIGHIAELVSTLLENGYWVPPEKDQRHRFPNRCPATATIGLYLRHRIFQPVP